jgi:hypothetical protein
LEAAFALHLRPSFGRAMAKEIFVSSPCVPEEMDMQKETWGGGNLVVSCKKHSWIIIQYLSLSYMSSPPRKETPHHLCSYHGVLVCWATLIIVQTTVVECTWARKLIKAVFGSGISFKIMRIK